MAPAGCQNHATQVMNNNIHNGLYQITIIPCKTELDVPSPSKPLLVLVKLGLQKIAYFKESLVLHIFSFRIVWEVTELNRSSYDQDTASKPNLLTDFWTTQIISMSCPDPLSQPQLRYVLRFA